MDIDFKHTVAARIGATYAMDITKFDGIVQVAARQCEHTPTLDELRELHHVAFGRDPAYARTDEELMAIVPDE